MTLDLTDIVDSASATHHRRLVVLAGDRDAAWRALTAAVSQLGRDALPARWVLLSRWPVKLPDGWERLHPRHAQRLLGQGPGMVAVDLHGCTEVRAMCVAAGAVRGGGLLVLLCPPLEAWPDQADELAERMAPPPFEVSDVRRVSLERIIAGTARAEHVSTGGVSADGSVEMSPTPMGRVPPSAARVVPEIPPHARFPDEVYGACFSTDQAEALLILEGLLDPPAAVVLAADRGRGKSSALGLAAHAFQTAGLRVVVTGPGPEAALEIAARVRELGGEPPPFVEPQDVVGADVLLVDEAATLSVPVLDRLSGVAPAVAFATTVHGYEGTGQGFAVRFRDHLRQRPGRFAECSLERPIRWSPGDPVEAWARDVFLLDAEPGPEPSSEPVVRELSPGELAANETLLRRLFGLLVHAHYRTTPEDLVRMLDGPNIRVLAALDRNRVAGALLIAEEGGLPAETCAGMLEGRFRVRGNMLPETLTCHLAEEESGELNAWRVLRLAVHPALRRNGIGTRLLDAALASAGPIDVDYLGAGFAATPDLLAFWRSCSFTVVRMAVTRSRVSGEHSAVVIAPTSRWGEALAARLDQAFVRRFPHVLADALRHLDPAVALAAYRAGPGRRQAPQMDEFDWRVLLACAFGALLYDGTVQPAWEVVRCHLADAHPPAQLTTQQNHLLLTKVLQHRPWSDVVAALELGDNHEAMRALRTALQPLVMAYGPPWIRREAARFAKEAR